LRRRHARAWPASQPFASIQKPRRRLAAFEAHLAGALEPSSTRPTTAVQAAAQAGALVDLQARTAADGRSARRVADQSMTR
jgi:hypothetical protein